MQNIDNEKILQYAKILQFLYLLYQIVDKNIIVGLYHFLCHNSARQIYCESEGRTIVLRAPEKIRCFAFEPSPLDLIPFKIA